MPDAVLKVASSGGGIHLKGDSKTHIFTIKTTAEPLEMYFSQSGDTFANGFITLNFVCLGCHDGNLARKQGFDFAQQSIGLIHSN